MNEESRVMGTLIVVSGPSGAGKTTIVEKSIAQNGCGARVITCTTRRPRQEETDGKDYRFFSRKDFRKKVSAGAFIEHAKVYGHYYGTLHADIEAARKNFSIAFLVTDVQGAATIMYTYPEAHSFFITVARKELIRRISTRGDSPLTLAKRITEIDAELAQAACFDKVIRNRTGRLSASVREFTAGVTLFRAMDEFVISYA